MLSRPAAVCLLPFALALLLLAVPAIAAAEPAKKAEPADDLAAARHLLLTGKYAEATEAYTKFAENEPAAALGLARCQAAVGDYTAAEQTLSKAIAAETKPDKRSVFDLNGPERQVKVVPPPTFAQLPAELALLAFQRGDYTATDKAVAEALKIDKDQLLARWIAAERLRVAGKLPAALAAYKWFVDYYNDHDAKDAESLCSIGLAAGQYARWKRLSDQFTFLVNDLYPAAAEAEEDYWPAHYEAGLLYLEKYNQADAAREFKAALQINPQAAEIHAAIARLALQNYDMDDARRSIERALEINPHLFAAYIYRAEMQLANFQTAEAIESLGEALKLNPVSEQALGTLAAAYGVVDGWKDGQSSPRFQKLIDQAVAHNAHAGEFFFALANGFDLTRKFPAAAHYYREAIARMPELIEPRGALGLMYMRLGEEVDAKKLLDESFEADPFNARVSNSLKVLEVLENYALLETKHFVIKFDRGKDELLAKYAAKYLEEEVYPELTKKFQFEPAGKSLFEIFQKARNTSGHGWFSARMVGLPYIGTVGACAGKMVALASPNDMPQKYNWARVLKHEFVHVLNLQQTNFNIPHWYTEALAVQSEGYPRPQSWNDMLRERVPKGRMFNLDSINLGFVRPQSGVDWQMAYCQAQLYAQYMLATYGDDALAKMLTAYADNLDTRAALKRSFGVEQADFEKGYLAYVKKIVADLSGPEKADELKLAELQRAQEAKPDDPDLAAKLAEAHLSRKQYPEARKLATKALELQPKHPLATYVVARVRLVIGEDDEALKLLEGSLDRNKPDPQVLQLLAGLKLRAEKYAEAAELYELGAQRFPHDPQWTRSLARVYLKSGDAKKLAPVLATLADADADDFLMRKKLAQLALDAKDYAAAVRWARHALEIDVMDPGVHRLLAQAAAQEHDDKQAIDEYLVAIKLDPQEPGLRFALADAYLQAKQPQQARKTLEELLKLAPDYAAAQLLLESLEEETK